MTVIYSLRRHLFAAVLAGNWLAISWRCWRCWQNLRQAFGGNLISDLLDTRYVVVESVRSLAPASSPKKGLLLSGQAATQTRSVGKTVLAYYYSVYCSYSSLRQSISLCTSGHHAALSCRFDPLRAVIPTLTFGRTKTYSTIIPVEG